MKSFVSDSGSSIKNVSRQKILKILINNIIATLAGILALLATLIIDPAIGRSTPTLIFFPAVIFSAWYGGLQAGILTSIISALEIYYFLLPPYSSFALKLISPLIQAALFIGEGVLISWFIEIGKRHKSVLEYRKREKENEKKIIYLEREQEKSLEKIRLRDEFLSVASHELKTPLTSMLLQIQTALHNIRNVSLAQFSVERLLKMLESTENQTKRLSRMINDLLNVSLIATGRLELELDKVDLSDVVKDVIQDFSDKLERENYKLILKADSAVVGQFDRVRIEQAIINLVSNAIKYGRGKSVTIETTAANDIGKIIVTDQGIGIPSKKQESIFELFERAVASEEYKGLGVGLYITRQIIKAHKGKITVDSREGRGSTFTIELPLNAKKKDLSLPKSKFPLKLPKPPSVQVLAK